MSRARVERRGSTLGVVVGSALLVGTAACGPDEPHANVPHPEPVETINVPADPEPEPDPAPNVEARPIPRVNPGPIMRDEAPTPDDDAPPRAL